ncbi:MAG: hypothetical protein WBL93_14805 [Lutisporaceae bacterium]
MERRIQRGNNKEYILKEDADKGYFIKQLTEYKLKYAIAAIENCYTLSEIGEHIGMSAAAVRDMLNRYNI